MIIKLYIDRYIYGNLRYVKRLMLHEYFVIEILHCIPNLSLLKKFKHYNVNL